MVLVLTGCRPKRTSSKALGGMFGTSKQSSGTSERTAQHENSGGLIWLDAGDPVNGPAFRPHHLKPIPSFMTQNMK